MPRTRPIRSRNYYRNATYSKHDQSRHHSQIIGKIETKERNIELQEIASPDTDGIKNEQRHPLYMTQRQYTDPYIMENAFHLSKDRHIPDQKKSQHQYGQHTDDSDIEMPRSKYLCQNRGIRAGFFKKSIEYPCLHYKSYPCNQRHTQRINQPFRNHRTQRFGKRCTIIFSQHPATGFIPYNLRRGFGLPTYEHQDSVWAYHFYRLIYRASHVSLLYDTRSNGLQTGEVSRFVHQLHYHYEEPIQNKLVVYNVSSSKTPALQVAKTEEVMNRLADFRSGGTRAISASAVNTYLDCPLKFYFSVVEGIREEEEVSETIESNVFGSILHKVMEELYQPFCGKMVTADLLKAIRKDTPMLTGAVARAFAEIFFKTDIVRPLTGQNFLIGEMIRKYVEKVLERDAKQTPFRYIESEKKIKCLFPLTDKSNIQLKGFIDRIDEVRDVVRIIDYKSGGGTTQFTSVEALFDKADTDRSKAVMQVFMYAWMYNRSVQLSTAIQPGIYYMRTLFSSSFDPGIYHRTDRFKTEQVLDFANYRTDFEDSLRNCLDEIFDTETPFVQTPNGKACMYCPFKDICGK